jgi:hypothetical protein
MGRRSRPGACKPARVPKRQAAPQGGTPRSLPTISINSPLVGRSAATAHRVDDALSVAFPVVDSAVAARERVAWQALAAFGAAGTGPGRRGVAATSDTTQRRWGGKDAVPPPADEAAVGSKVNTKGKGARSDGAQANADESAVVTSAEDANTDVGFDVDLPSDEADIDREWADVSPTVRDSAPTPQHGRADLSQDPAPTGAP